MSFTWHRPIHTDPTDGRPFNFGDQKGFRRWQQLLPHLVQQPAMASENIIKISANVAGDKKLLIKQAVEKVRIFLVT
jgi:hypothetical protein